MRYLIIVLVCFIAAQIQAQEKGKYRNWTIGGTGEKDHIALILANNYYGLNGELDHPIPASKRLEKVLLEKGFDVFIETELSLEDMREVITNCAEKFENYKSAFIFYLGHGLEVNGNNYLIPVDFKNGQSPEDIRYSALNVDYILNKFDDPRKPKVVVFDACRENPFTVNSKYKSVLKQGFKPMVNSPWNFEILFSTKKNSLVKDDNPFIDAFIETLESRDCYGNMYADVADIVSRKTSYEQLPARYCGITGEICFGAENPNPSPDPDPHPDYGLSLVYVEGGSFDMGSSSGHGNESPVHRVTLDGFSMSKYEITNKQYCAFLNEKGNQFEGGVEWIDLAGSYGGEKCRIYERSGRFYVESGYEDHAVIYVSWYGARAYCTWMSSKIRKKVRLPTESEWEYAARGGKKSRGYTYSGSNTIGEVAWYDVNDDNSVLVQKVGGKSPNELGLYDMSGNVYEWCSDWYGKDYYSSSPSRNPKGPSSGDYKVLRGGSWRRDALGCRVANRYGSDPGSRGDDGGFRVALPQ